MWMSYGNGSKRNGTSPPCLLSNLITNLCRHGSQKRSRTLEGQLIINLSSTCDILILNKIRNKLILLFYNLNLHSFLFILQIKHLKYQVFFAIFVNRFIKPNFCRTFVHVFTCRGSNDLRLRLRREKRRGPTRKPKLDARPTKTQRERESDAEGAGRENCAGREPTESQRKRETRAVQASCLSS